MVSETECVSFVSENMLMTVNDFHNTFFTLTG
jgi:hypothetical protein